MADDIDRDRALKAEFEQAAAGQQKKIEEPQGEKAQPSPRTTSVAKTLDEATLARARSAKDHFNRAATGQQHTIERNQGEKDQAFRHAPAQQPQLRPDGAMAKPADREAHQERQTKLDTLSRAEQQLQHYKTRISQQKLVDLDKSEYDKDRDDRSR